MPAGASRSRRRSVDVTQCPRCASSLRILSVITQPDVIQGILHDLDLPTRPPSSSRAPPAQVDLPSACKTLGCCIEEARLTE
jgi:hypothetical protein